jgi:DNA-binding GntR family transcriptional regulator
MDTDVRRTIKSTSLRPRRALARRQNTRDLTEFAYQRIKDLILRYEFKPGQKLTQEDLAARLGVSLTPVREALRILEKEGYAAPVRNRGFFVGEISLKEAEELFEVREALEVLSVEKAIKYADETFLHALDACTREYQRVVTQALTRERILMDQRFHLLIARQADNENLRRTLEHVFERITLKRKIEGAPPARGIVAYDEHVVILQAIREGDVGRARDLVGVHVRNAKDAVLRQLRERQTLLDS